MSEETELTAQVICGARAAMCRCQRPPGHDGNHHCDCGGQYMGSDATGDFAAKLLPQRGIPPELTMLNPLFDLLCGDPD